MPLPLLTPPVCSHSCSLWYYMILLTLHELMDFGRGELHDLIKMFPPTNKVCIPICTGFQSSRASCLQEIIFLNQSKEHTLSLGQ